MRIGGFEVLRDGGALVMAEIGVNHDGSGEKGRRLVEAAKGAGCDLVKFQLFEARRLLAKEAGLVGYQKGSAGSAEELLDGLEMGAREMGELVRVAQGLGMGAVVTPFSCELVGACVEMGVDGIKLASPDLVNWPLVEEVCRTGLPLIFSTGAATMGEVVRTVGWVREFGAIDRLVVLHCVSSYPTAASRAALGGIAAMRAEFPGMAIGYSDHTVEVATGGLAVAAGACLLEKHLTLDRKAPGPDHAASLEPGEMGAYVRFAREAFLMRGAMVKEPQEVEMEVREQTRQSLVAVRDLAAGEVLERGMLTTKRPGTGVAAGEMLGVVGRRLLRAVRGGDMLKYEDIETEPQSHRGAEGAQR